MHLCLTGECITFLWSLSLWFALGLTPPCLYCLTCCLEVLVERNLLTLCVWPLASQWIMFTTSPPKEKAPALGNPSISFNEFTLHPPFQAWLLFVPGLSALPKPCLHKQSSPTCF